MRYSWLPLGLLLAAVLAFAGTAVSASMSLSELLARDAQRAHALHTQTELQRLLTLLVDIETGQRGFIITGQAPFLRPYELALGELSQLHAGLRERLVQSGTGDAALRRLDALIQQRLDQAERAVAARIREGDAASRDLGAYVDGKRIMDELRYEIEQIGRAQQQRVADADEGAREVQQRTTFLARLLPGVGLVALGLSLALLRRERGRRDQAERALRDANASLERLVDERTAALRRALRRIQSFAAELDRSIETERRRLAREVHDQVGQVGTAIKMLTFALRAKLAPRVEPLLDEMQSMADEAIRAARQIAAALRPPLLDELGLEPALSHHLQTLQRQSGLEARLELADAELLSAEQAGQLFRIVQEACTNVLRHAQAASLTVRGRCLCEAVEGYELEVVDDGRGPGDTRADASGLRNMRERAVLAGGRFEFGAAPERGTRVAVWLPLHPPAPAEPEEVPA